MPFPDDAFWPVGKNKDQHEEKVQYDSILKLISKEKAPLRKHATKFDLISKSCREKVFTFTCRLWYG